jgi:hypothetical protein
MKPTEPHAQPQTQNSSIRLADVAANYLGALQKIYDITCYTLSGSRKLNESDYDEFSGNLQVMPQQSTRLDFESAKEVTEQWLLRNSLGDSVSLITPLLEDVRTIASLCQFKASGSKDGTKVQKIVTDDRAAFLPIPLEDKFKKLKEEYGIASLVQEHVESLILVVKTLMWRQGIVTKEDLGSADTLKVKIRSVQIVAANGPESSGQGSATMSLTKKMGDSEKEFKVGDKIRLTKAEHMGAIITITLFVGSLLEGLQAYARSTGAADD